MLAELYDAFCAGRPDFGFYLPLVMSAESVLDVGCGTGELLRLAREAGHTGRLCGLDPAYAMLDQARKRPDVEWVLGDLSSVEWRREFDLVVMTGHAFQVQVEDEELRESLASMRSSLAEDGRLVFETRNPLARGWENWTPENAVEIEYGGSVVRMAHEVEEPVAGDVVSFTSPRLGRGSGQQKYVEVPRRGRAVHVLARRWPVDRGAVRGLGSAAANGHESGDHYSREAGLSRLSRRDEPTRCPWDGATGPCDTGSGCPRVCTGL